MVYMSKDDDDGDDDNDDERIQHSLWADITINKYFRWLIVGMKSKALVRIFLSQAVIVLTVICDYYYCQSFTGHESVIFLFLFNRISLNLNMMKLFQSGKVNQARKVMCHNKFASCYNSQLYYLFSPGS